MMSQAWILSRPPFELALCVALLSLLTEEGALALTVIAVQQNLLSYEFAWSAATFGIVSADLLTYGAAFGLRRVHFLWRYAWLERWKHRLESWIARQEAAFDLGLVLSHFLPGSRLLLYSAAGWVGYSLTRFSLLILLSTSLWVLAVLALGKRLLDLFHPSWLTTGLGAVALVLLIGTLRYCQRLRRRTG